MAELKALWKLASSREVQERFQVMFVEISDIELSKRSVSVGAAHA